MLEELIESLKGEFDLTDKGNLEAFLGIKTTKHYYDTIEFTQPHLI